MRSRQILTLAGATLLLAGCVSRPREGNGAALKPAEPYGSSAGCELPSFYDRRNRAEAYGHCPKCGAWIRGSYISALGSEGCVSGWWGYCQRCDLSLVSEAGFFLREPRIVRWKIERLKKAQRSPLDAQTALCFHIEHHWTGASESERSALASSRV
jgi:hypothetical protein